MGRKVPGRSPSSTHASNLFSSLQTLQELPDVWDGWQKSDAEMKLVCNDNFALSQSPQAAARLRKALENPTFVKLFTRLKAEMDLAVQAPLRKIVIHYRADESIYPSDEVMLHFSTHEHLRQFLVLCSRQGRVRPEHPEYPLCAEGFTAKVRRNPMHK